MIDLKKDSTALKARIFQKEDALRDRVIFLAMDVASVRRGVYKHLEELTGIPATRWRNVMLKRQMPTLAMLMALMDYRRPYAEWLLTGDDPTLHIPTILKIFHPKECS
ncbi:MULTISPECIES: hypothetical protein [Alcaligenaceae]|uniref:hypothetical protein n=1 Tax=Alcaligenaceae TaxID=506 RepID=UPI001300A8D3|nr:hypothetical protein [Bordetella bronchiseptica]